MLRSAAWSWTRLLSSEVLLGQRPGLSGWRCGWLGGMCWWWVADNKNGRHVTKDIRPWQNFEQTCNFTLTDIWRKWFTQTFHSWREQNLSLMDPSETQRWCLHECTVTGQKKKKRGKNYYSQILITFAHLQTKVQNNQIRTELKASNTQGSAAVVKV